MTRWAVRCDTTRTVIGDWEDREAAERVRAIYQAQHKRSFSVVKVTP